MIDANRQRLHDTSETLRYAFVAFSWGARLGVGPVRRWKRWLRLESAAKAWLSAVNACERDEEIPDE